MMQAGKGVYTEKIVDFDRGALEIFGNFSQLKAATEEAGGLLRSQFTWNMRVLGQKKMMKEAFETYL